MNHFHYRDGKLRIDETAVETVARAVPTPFYLYSQGEIVDRFRAFDGAAKRRLKSHLTCFAVKSNFNPAIVGLLAKQGAGADIVSGGELLLALKSGVPADKIVYSGVGKTAEELKLAVETGIKRINVESAEEAVLLNEIAVSSGKKADIALRVNPDVDARTHDKIATGRAENKFGVDWTRARELYRDFSAAAGLNPVGIDVHVGSQLLEIEPFAETFERAARIARLLRADGVAISSIDVGGGLGVAYKPADAALSPDAYMETASRILGGDDCEIIFEPGRFLVADAGVLISRVVRVKQARDRRFLVLDAGMNDLVRPAMYDAWHNVRPVRQGGEDRIYDVVGPVCESGDVFGKARVLPEMKAGDLVAIETAGAYGAAMASNYNFRPLCAEVLANGGDYAVIRERQSMDDMLKNTRPAPWL